MRRFSLSALLLAILGLPAILAPSQQPAPTPGQAPQPQKPGGLVVEARLVNVVFAVTDRRFRFITDLGKDDFQIFEDNEAQEISFFDRRTDLPLRIGLLLDTSNSIRQRLKFEQEAATDFLYSVISAKKDQAFLMTFDNEPEVVQNFTDDKETLASVLRQQRAGGGTALYDAIYLAARDRLFHPPVAAEPSGELRRVLVVISDGDDTLSEHTRSEAIEMAQRAEVAVYSISTSTDWLTVDTSAPQKYHMTPGDQVLRQLADETGGRAFYPYKLDDLEQSFQDIGTELRNQYSIGYVPTNRSQEPRFRRIKITVDRKGLIVRARKGYFSPRSLTQTAAPPAK